MNDTTQYFIMRIHEREIKFQINIASLLGGVHVCGGGGWEEKTPVNVFMVRDICFVL